MPVLKSSAPCPGAVCTAPGAGVERDVVPEHADRVARVQRMAEPRVLELDALHARDRGSELSPRRRCHRRRERLRHDHGAAADVVRGVVELGMERDGQVRRDRPRRGRPDQDRDLAAGQRRHARGQLAGALGRELKLDVDRRRGMILVLDFRLGQRGPAMNAPVHRLLALVDEPLFDEPAERARDRRLILEVHRQVRVVPGAEDAEALKLLRSCCR